MPYNATQTFSHTNKDTAKNFVNGIRKFKAHLFSIKKTASIDNEELNAELTDIVVKEKTSWKKFILTSSYLPKIPQFNFRDKHPVSLYKNNFEPQALKDIGKIIGTKKVYDYIIREALNILLQDLIPVVMSYFSDKMTIEAEKMMVPADARTKIGPNQNYFKVQIFNQILMDPIARLSKFISKKIIKGSVEDLEVKHIIKAKIGSESFLPLYLHDYAQNEYNILEDNIFSILKSYSSAIAQTISLALKAGYIYKIYKFFPGAKLTFTIGSILFGLKSLFEFTTKNIFVKISEEDAYKMIVSEVNIAQDRYNIKATVFTPGIGHFNDREIFKDKHDLQLAEEKFWLEGLDFITDVGSLQRALISCYSAINFADEKLRNGQTWFEFRTDFNRLNNIFFDSINRIPKLITSNSRFALKTKQVNKLVQAIDSYTDNNIENKKIYQNNNSSKLIISNLRADVVATNQTIVNFSDYSLSIEVSSGRHYLMEGQNSVGKSLILKLLSGYSGGLTIKGSISYPHGFEKDNLYYFSQDDYTATLKPILHRLAMPKLLPADYINQDSLMDNDKAISKQEFDDMVEFMALLLSRMKYDAKWKTIDDARVFLLENYAEYVRLIKEGSEEAWQSIIDAHNNLTGGQIKKLGLANAIHREVKLLILDESLNAIDQPTKLEIYKLIKEFLPESIVLVLQHQVADNLITLKQNKEKVDEIKSDLKEIQDTNHSQKVDKIIDKVNYFIDSPLEEELDFYDAVITMFRVQTEDNKVTTWFKVSNLHNHNETLAEFYQNAPEAVIEEISNNEVKFYGDTEEIYTSS